MRARSKSFATKWTRPTRNRRRMPRREMKVQYGWVDKNKIGVMEMSEAAGMRRLQTNDLNPEITGTFGVGEMIVDAAERGSQHIIIGLGGSATNDGGFGMARGLGFRF